MSEDPPPAPAGPSSHAPLPRVAIFLARELDPSAWSERHRTGQVLDPSPYGYHQASPWYQLSWSRSHEESSIRRSVRLRIYAALGFDLVHAWQNRQVLRTADAIWTHTEREHLAVAAVQWLTPWRRRVPVLAQSVWLWDVWPRYGRARRALVAMLLRTHPVEAVHSDVNRRDSLAAVPGRAVVLVPFGTSRAQDDRAPVTGEAPLASSVPSTSGRPQVLTVGNDRDRDWELVAEVARLRPDLQFRVVSGAPASRAVAWPANAVVEPVSRRQELGKLYRAADVVIIAIRPNRHASGATTLIEALASGCQVVLTDAGGLGDYAGDAAARVPPGDALAMATALDSALESGARGAPDVVAVRGLTQEDYVGRYVLLTQWLLGRSPLSPAVSRFEPVGLLSPSGAPRTGEP